MEMSAQSPVRQLAAVHDLSGVGRTSLSVVIPILSTMGVKVCSLPTAVLSSHSRYEGFHFTDLTDQMKPIIEHWKQLGIAFDAVYSGFLGSHRQVSIVEEVIDTLCRDQSMVVTDPVLGDNGTLVRYSLGVSVQDAGRGQHQPGIVGRRAHGGVLRHPSPVPLKGSMP